MSRFLRVGAQRARVCRGCMRSDDLIGCDAAVDPPIERSDSIECVRAGTAAAVAHAGNEE